MPTADYSIVPYEPVRLTLGSSAGGYYRPMPPLTPRAPGLRERWPEQALNGRSTRPPRPQPTYSARRTLEDSGPALTGLMVDIFV